LKHIPIKSRDSLLKHIQYFGIEKEYIHPLIHVQKSKTIPTEKALICLNNIPSDTLLFYYENSCQSIRTRTSIQVGDNIHIEAGIHGSFINHSCNPNCIVRTDYCVEENKGKVFVISTKPLKTDEEIVFDYATTESEVTKELCAKSCLCNSSNCRGKIYGFNNLPQKDRIILLEKDIISDHLKKINAK